MIAGTVQPNPKIMGMNARTGKSQLAHNPFHDIGNTGHISAVLQKSQCQKQNENVRQESQDTAHTGDDTVYQQGAQHFIDPGSNSVHRLSMPTGFQFLIPEYPFSQSPMVKVRKNTTAMIPRKIGILQNSVRQCPVCLFRQSVLPILIDQHFPDDLLDKIILLIDDVRFIVPVDHIRQIDRITFVDLLILLQQLNGVPAVIRQIRIFPLQLRHDKVNLVLNSIAVNHCIF